MVYVSAYLFFLFGPLFCKGCAQINLLINLVLPAQFSLQTMFYTSVELSFFALSDLARGKFHLNPVQHKAFFLGQTSAV